MKWGVDGAYAPVGPEAFRLVADGWSFVCGYIGGKVLHVWSADDWHVADGVGLALLPIWVAPLVEDAGRQAGVDDGNLCLEAMRSLGLSGTVALDVENGLAPREYATGFLDACTAGSLGVALYGSANTILEIGDLPWSRWWLAWWPEPGMMLIPAHPDWSMWQFSTGQRFDYNVAADDFPFALLQSPEAPSATPSAEA